MQLPHCKCLLAWPGATKHDEKLPGGQAVWGIGGVHKAASHPASYLWDGAPERGRGCPGGGQSQVPVRAASVVSPEEVQPACGTKPSGGKMGIHRLGRDCWGDWQRAGILGRHPSLRRMGVPQQQRLEAHCCRQQREGVCFTY